jgi:sec-independent protein translocase protein TatA
MPIGPLELVLILIIALLVFGGRRIPEAGRALGGGIRSLIDGVRGIHEEEPEEPIKVGVEPETLPPGRRPDPPET